MRDCMLTKKSSSRIKTEEFKINQAYEITIFGSESVQTRDVIITAITDNEIKCLCHDRSVFIISVNDLMKGKVFINATIGEVYSHEIGKAIDSITLVASERFFEKSDRYSFNSKYWCHHHFQDYMVWVTNEKGAYRRFYGTFVKINDNNELLFKTSHGNECIDFPRIPDSLVIIPIEELIDQRYLQDIPPEGLQ